MITSTTTTITQGTDLMVGVIEEVPASNYDILSSLTTEEGISALVVAGKSGGRRKLKLKQYRSKKDKN